MGQVDALCHGQVAKVIRNRWLHFLGRGWHWRSRSRRGNLSMLGRSLSSSILLRLRFAAALCVALDWRSSWRLRLCSFGGGSPCGLFLLGLLLQLCARELLLAGGLSCCAGLGLVFGGLLLLCLGGLVLFLCRCLAFGRGLSSFCRHEEGELATRGTISKGAAERRVGVAITE